MDELLKHSWWMLALRGFLALLFGILAIIWPGATLLVLVAFFAAWMLIGGGASVYAAMSHRRDDKGWWVVLLLGLVSLAAGVVAVLNPGITILVLVVVMAVNALITGILEIAMAIRLRKHIRREWMLAVAGAVSVVFGALVLFFPMAGAFAMVWLVSFYAVFTGLLLLTLAFRARRWQTRGEMFTDTGRHYPEQPAV